MHLNVRGQIKSYGITHDTGIINNIKLSLLIEMLHPRIREASLEEFNKGSWLGAIRSACAEVDHAIRELVGDLDTSRYVPTSTIVKEMFGVGKKTIRTIGLIPNASKRDIEKARKDLEHIINGVLGYYRNPLYTSSQSIHG